MHARMHALEHAIAADSSILDLISRWPDLPAEVRGRILEFFATTSGCASTTV